eukprot:2557982-Rhodomonas_salina.2
MQGMTARKARPGPPKPASHPATKAWRRVKGSHQTMDTQDLRFKPRTGKHAQQAAPHYLL